MKKLALLLVMCAFLFALSVPKPVHAETINSSNEVEQKFINDLVAQSKSSNPTVKETAIENLNTFKNFDEATKKEFLKIIQDPTLMEKNMTVTTSASAPTNNNFVSYAASTTKSKTISKNFDFKILGLKIYGIHLELNYKVKSSRVTSTTSASSYVTYSNQPLATLTQVHLSHKIANDGQAYAKAKYSYSMNPFRGLNYQAGVQAVSIGGDGVGNLVYTNNWKE